MTDRCFVDTNVLVYFYSDDEPAKQRRSAELLAELVESRSVVVSTQVLQELYSVLTRKLGLPAGEAEICLEAVAQLPVVTSDAELVLDAARLAGAARISIWDALIIAAAQASGCARLLTEDLSAGQRFADLEVVNPFA